MDSNTQPPDEAKLPSAGQDRPDLVVEQRHFKREIAVILALFVLLIPAVWVVFSSKSPNDLKLERAEEKLRFDRIMGQAQKHINQDYLSVREQGNAVTALEQASDLTNSRAQIDVALERIGQRYLELLNRAIAEQDWHVFEETIEAAHNIEDEMPFVGYDQQLKNLKAKALHQQELETQRHQQALETNPDLYETLNHFQDNINKQQLGPAMVVLPAGQFSFGSPLTESGRDGDEGPAKLITMEAFAIGETEVTFDDYSLFAEATGNPVPSDSGWGHGSRPVINVSWIEATQYAVWLSQATGFKYRLPTEAEWEYAARAGTMTPFVYGPCVNSKQANFNSSDNEAYENCPRGGPGLQQTIETKTLEPNPWGLYNIQGNVREWVKDCWITDYQLVPDNGQAVYITEGGGCSIAGGKRVLRGGDWESGMRTIRTANRYALDERERGTKYGFRVVREL